MLFFDMIGSKGLLFFLQPRLFIAFTWWMCDLSVLSKSNKRKKRKFRGGACPARVRWHPQEASLNLQSQVNGIRGESINMLLTVAHRTKGDWVWAAVRVGISVSGVFYQAQGTKWTSGMRCERAFLTLIHDWPCWNWQGTSWREMMAC